MVKGRSLFIGAGIFVAMVILLIFSLGTFEVDALSKAPEQPPSYQLRPDIITFDLPKDTFKTVFLHDKHTDALQKKNKDCSTCHMDDNGRISLKFKRIKDVSPEELTKIYCDNCTKCHTEIAAAGERPGRQIATNLRKNNPCSNLPESPLASTNHFIIAIIKLRRMRVNVVITNMTKRTKNWFTPKTKRVHAVTVTRKRFKNRLQKNKFL